MGKIDCFEIEGVKTIFRSNDHEPPHFHARRPGEWHIRVKFLKCTKQELDYEYVRGRKSVKRKHRKKILEAVWENKEELLNEWNQKVDS